MDKALAADWTTAHEVMTRSPAGFTPFCTRWKATSPIAVTGTAGPEAGATRILPTPVPSAKPRSSPRRFGQTARIPDRT